MRWAGILLGVGGVWVLCQVFGGDALGRLNITGAGSKQLTAQAAGGASIQAPGPPANMNLPPGMTS